MYKILFNRAILFLIKDVIKIRDNKKEGFEFSIV